MKRNFYFLYIILLLYFSHFIVAQNLTNIQDSGIDKITKINIQITQNGFVKVEKELILNEATAKILIPKQTKNLLIFDSRNNQLGYNLSRVEEEQLLTIYLKSLEDRNIKFSYTTQSLTRKNASTWTFKFSSITTPRLTIIKIELPQNANTTTLRTNQTLYFYPGNLASPLFLYPQDEKVNFEIDYFSIGEVSIEKIGDNFLIYLVPTLLIIIIFSVVLILYKKRKLEEKGKEVKEGGEEIKKDEEVKEEIREERSLRAIKSSVLNMLDENEKKVIEILYNSKEEEITQAYIYKTLNIPKASLSDIIRRLEHRNLIEKRKYGRVNWIKLKEWVFK